MWIYWENERIATEFLATPWNSKNSRDSVLGIPKGFQRAEATEIKSKKVKGKDKKE